MCQKHKGFLHTRRAETGYLLHTFNLLDAVLDSAAALNCAILIHSAVCPKTEAFCTTSCAGNSYFLHTRRAETGYLLHTFNLLDAVRVPGVPPGARRGHDRHDPASQDR